LAEKIEAVIGDGSRFGLRVVYSHEAEALETAGGIVQALDYLDDRFVVVNGDISTDYPFEKLLQIETEAHLVLVKNPEFHPQGDFVLDNGLLSNNNERRHTYAGIACYHRSFFNGLKAGRRSVVPLLRQAADNRSLSGELYEGNWTDIGTLDRWQAAKI
jgi:MurNAc alpha-1-phosphate uridylyltransferase